MIKYSIIMIWNFDFVLNPQVFQLSIGAACRLIWPLDRLIVQVLDDSTDPTIMVHINDCVQIKNKQTLKVFFSFN